MHIAISGRGLRKIIFWTSAWKLCKIIHPPPHGFVSVVGGSFLTRIESMWINKRVTIRFGYTLVVSVQFRWREGQHSCRTRKVELGLHSNSAICLSCLFWKTAQLLFFFHLLHFTPSTQWLDHQTEAAVEIDTVEAKETVMIIEERSKDSLAEHKCKGKD
jgi:hypothetical protein